MKIKNGRMVLFLPPIIYDLAQLIFFPLNYVISLLCYLQKNKPTWNNPGFESQKVIGSGKALEQIKKEIIEGQDLAYKDEDLVLLYDSLPSVKAREDLIGRTWKGRVLRTNASVLDIAEWLFVRPLGILGFKWGKRYRTSEKGDPLLVRWLDKLYFPIPIWGNVGMVDIRWRGDVTATMNYDHQPWKDYFKLLSNENGEMTLLGVWTHKHITGGWFVLTLDPDIATQMFE